MTTLTADPLLNNPEVSQAIDTLLDALKTHQAHITGITPPNPKLQKDYNNLLDDFAQSRGGNTFFPYISSGIGNGPYIQLADGSVKLDFITGIGVHLFGHSHPDITKASIHAALIDTVMQGHLQQSYHTPILSNKLLQLANKNNANLPHCFITSSGVMTNENALKMAFQKNHPADRVLAFERCFAGRTLANAWVTDKAAYRQGLPSTLKVDYIPFFDANDPEGSTQRAADTLHSLIKRYPGQHAAMIYELIQGEGGFYPGSHQFHSTLMKICREHHIANIVDEVQTFLRTSEPFTFQYFQLDDLVDLVCIGKNSQICATLYTAEYKPQPGLVAQTFTASTSAILSAITILELLENNNYFGPNGKIMTLGNHFRSNLEQLEQKHPDRISGPYGEASMVGFTPLKGDPHKIIPFIKDLFTNGLMGFGAGSNPMRLRFLMPILSTSTHHIDEATNIIESTISTH